MRIAIYHNLPSGGGKRALYEMVRRLAAQHEISVFTLSTADRDFCDLRPHCRQHLVYPFDTLSLARRPFGRLNRGIRTLDLLKLEAVQRKIAADIDQVGYDVAFIHNCRFSQSPGLLKFLRTPSVYYCQEPPRLLYDRMPARPYSRISRLQKLGNRFDPFPFLYRRTLARLDHGNTLAATSVLVNSAYSRETVYKTYGISARVCYLGVDTTLFCSTAAGEGHFLLSVGALSPLKGFDFLIESMAKIPASDRPALVIASNITLPDEKAYLGQLAHALNVAVEFRASVSDDGLVELYNRAQATVYAPVMEPFGFVPLESMACGKAVIGVREAGVRESIENEKTGLLTERDAEEFAGAVRELLSEPSRKKEMGAAGYNQVRERWTWNKCVTRIEAELERAASNAGRVRLTGAAQQRTSGSGDLDKRGH